MNLGHVQFGPAKVSRLVIGGNPFSGFAHQTPARGAEMKQWYTVARIKEALRRAEDIGVDTHLGRADHHVMRTLLEYWNEGGRIQWSAHTCPGVGPIDRGVRNAIEGHAVACFVHGGVMDHALANDGLAEVPPAIDMIKKAGIAAGIACHNPAVLDWAEANLDCDFYMCCYYNPEPRDRNAEMQRGYVEQFLAEDRQRMATRIQSLSKPAIHYKVMAAGRNDPAEAFDFVARHLRPTDAVCVGVHTKDKWDMLAEDGAILEQRLRGHGKL